jgi:hypothetical protein
MVATSFNRTTLAVGRTWWTRIHRTGMHYLSGIFAFDFFLRPFTQPDPVAYLPLAALLAGAYGVRFAAWKRRRDKRAAAARLLDSSHKRPR